MALAMARAIAHRGPDHQASWADARRGIALGHARLSIIDLSDAANQPMRTLGDRYAIVFNGEIYNFAELAQELRAAGYAFASRGDTEVIPAAVDHWGIERAVQRMNGIFAFALFDRTQRILHLVRDHVGVKPLYFGVQDGELLFASTLRAFLAHPRFRGDIDPAALAAYVRYAYVPAPLSIFRDVVKLDPGCIATIDAGLNVRTFAALRTAIAVIRLESTPPLSSTPTGTSATSWRPTASSSSASSSPSNPASSDSAGRYSGRPQ
jgi:asparagine synthase (glutamine-hydrolysing)